MRYDDRPANHEPDVEHLEALLPGHFQPDATLEMVRDAVVAAQDQGRHEPQHLLDPLVQRRLLVCLPVESQEALDPQVSRADQAFVHLGPERAERLQAGDVAVVVPIRHEAKLPPGPLGAQIRPRTAEETNESRRVKMSIRILLSCIALALLPQSGLAQITVNLDAEGRPAAEKERDATSKPMEVLEWIGVEEGGVVLDIQSGGGYHVWIFSDAVGAAGKVYSQSSFRPESLQARIASGATPEANVTFVSEVAEVPD